MGNRRGRDIIGGWLSPWSRNLMLAIGYGLVVASLFTMRSGFIANDGRTILSGAVVGFLGWLLSALMPDPVPAPRKSERRRAAKLARVGGHQLPH